jgi:ectoine hydroxylase-related dioxygenase (phytanoyl-CoA dioxygenase family)
MQLPITQEHIDFYQENGFVQVDNILSPDELAELREFLDETLSVKQSKSHHSDDQGAYYKVLNQRVNTWRDHAGMAKYVTHPRFAEIARRLTGASAVRLFHDHALLKMPGDSKPTPWHQDTTYWPMVQNGALSIWIALDDVDENNGCMMFVPKSRSVGKLNPIDLVNPQDIFEYVKDTDLASTKPVLVRMKAGSCTFHDGLTFHYAHANKTDKPRRALAIIYMLDGTIYNGKNHVVTDGVPYLTPGEPFRGGLFPILARQA